MPLEPVERALRILLIENARRSRRLTYAEVARALSPFTTVRLERPYSPLHGWLGAVSRFELEAGRPLLSAIVITQDSGRPGEGFFRFAAGDLGLQFVDEEQFWNEQVAAIERTWATATTTLLATHKVRLSDGREVRVREYAGGSLRILIDDPPYVISEAFLTRGSTNRAILKLDPRPNWLPAAPEEAE